MTTATLTCIPWPTFCLYFLVAFMFTSNSFSKLAYTFLQHLCLFRLTLCMTNQVQRLLVLFSPFLYLFWNSTRRPGKRNNNNSSKLHHFNVQIKRCWKDSNFRRKWRRYSSSLLHCNFYKLLSLLTVFFLLFSQGEEITSDVKTHWWR